MRIPELSLRELKNAATARTVVKSINKRFATMSNVLDEWQCDRNSTKKTPLRVLMHPGLSG